MLPGLRPSGTLPGGSGKQAHSGDAVDEIVDFFAITVPDAEQHAQPDANFAEHFTCFLVAHLGAAHSLNNGPHRLAVTRAKLPRKVTFCSRGCG